MNVVEQPEYIHSSVDLSRAHYAVLRAGTVLCAGVEVDPHVISSGENLVGARTVLRYGVILARGCTIGEDCYISPRVMFENLNHRCEAIGGAKVGDGCFIGTHAIIAAGITIAPGTVIGSGANVRKDITEPGTYKGNPARRAK